MLWSPIGYYAKPSKSWLIVKLEYLEDAKEVFKGTGIQITTEGQRHLGAVVGSEHFKLEYVTGKIDGWIAELEKLGVGGEVRGSNIWGTILKDVTGYSYHKKIHFTWLDPRLCSPTWPFP